MAVGRRGSVKRSPNRSEERSARAACLKVRLDADDAAGAEELADALARLVAATCCGRIGRVAILYRKPAEPGP
jgi:RNA-binding protein YhbY